MAEWYGEDAPMPTPTNSHLRQTSHFFQEPIEPRILSFHEASRCLNTLGKDESGVRYAYLMLTATEKKLTDISVITNFKHLLYLDLSGNYLDLNALQSVCEIPYLLYLKAERNVIESAALKPIPYLQVLLLNKNQITETRDISQAILETLELGENSVCTPQFPEDEMVELKTISLHGNYLIDTSGTYPKNLENLYLNRNRIMKVTPQICNLKQLRVLNLRDNFIKKLNGFASDLENLTYLNLRGNRIEQLRQFKKLQCLPKLHTLIVLENPIYKNSKESYEEEGDTVEEEESEEAEEVAEQYRDDKKIRLAILVLLPYLKRINKLEVSDQERKDAKEKTRQLTAEIFADESSEDEEVTFTASEVTTEYVTENSLEMKGTPFDSTAELEKFLVPVEREEQDGNEEIYSVPYVDG